MFMAAVKETDEALSEKRVKLEENPLPTSAALHQLVPVEIAKRKAPDASEGQIVAVPNVGVQRYQGERQGQNQAHDAWAASELEQAPWVSLVGHSSGQPFAAFAAW